MKIGVDIRDLKSSTTGQKTYLEELCLSLCKQTGKENEICLLDTSIPLIQGKSKLIKLLDQFNLHFWKQCLLPLKAIYKRCDILICTDYFVPYFHPGFKTVVVFHDAFFFEHKNHYHPLFIWLFKNIALPSAKRCAFIIVPSEYAKKQIQRYYIQIPFEKLIVIHEGPKTLPNENSSSSDSIILEQLGLRNTQYLLHVGVMNKRKNIPFLLKTFAKLLEKGYDYKLVLAGSLQTSQYISDEQTIIETITSFHLKEKVVLTGYLSNNDLATIYKNASIYVFPSLNEGFGLPILEAFRFGLPVLVANNSCLPEIGGNAVLSFDPRQESDLLDKLILVIDNPELNLELSKKGLERLNDFSWDKTADQILRQISNSCIN